MLQTKQQIGIYAEYDRVIFNAGALSIELPYVVAFNIAQAIKLTCKEAMRRSGEEIRKWEVHAKVDGLPDTYRPINRTLRGKYTWATGWDGEDIKLRFNDQILQLHFTDGLKVSQWLRMAGATAKQAINDRRRIVTAQGFLTNAEDNYRLNIN